MQEGVKPTTLVSLLLKKGYCFTLQYQKVEFFTLFRILWQMCIMKDVEYFAVQIEDKIHVCFMLLYISRAFKEK